MCAKSRLACQRGEAFRRVLIRILSVDGFTCFEADLSPGEVHGLRDHADQMHFDALEGLVVKGVMAETAFVEIRPQLAKIGRASCRERAESQDVAGALSTEI